MSVGAGDFTLPTFLTVFLLSKPAASAVPLKDSVAEGNVSRK